VSSPSLSTGRDRLIAGAGSGLVAATAFATGDVIGKVALGSGADVLTMLTFRSVVGLGFMWVWLRFAAAPVPHSDRARWVSLGLGVLFSANVFALFKAIELLPVPIAILTYFVYPLLTGIGGALTGLDRLTWRGAAAALVAFLGLALMLRAHPGGLDPVGIAFALAASVIRTVMLLITRASLSQSDARLSTWYSLLSSTLVFVVICALTQTWNAPQTNLGWAAFIGISITTTIAILAVFVSTKRVGPFRTALIMNLEPLLATVLSVLFLGDVITPLQAAGGAIMIAALCVFQLRR
jgi:drug/metabolite transporter (DMT)-like permease